MTTFIAVAAVVLGGWTVLAAVIGVAIGRCIALADSHAERLAESGQW